jgi:hypothetical protein
MDYKTLTILNTQIPKCNWCEVNDVYCFRRQKSKALSCYVCQVRHKVCKRKGGKGDKQMKMNIDVDGGFSSQLMTISTKFTSLLR